MTKPVRISSAAYEAPAKVKKNKLSFSDVVLSLIENSIKRPGFHKFIGDPKAPANELEKFMKQVEEDRIRNAEKM